MSPNFQAVYLPEDRSLIDDPRFTSSNDFFNLLATTERIICSGLTTMSGISTATREAEAAGGEASAVCGVPDSLGAGLEEGCCLGSAFDVGSGKVAASSGYIEWISFILSANESICLSREPNLSEAAYFDAIVFFAMAPRILVGPTSMYLSTEFDPENKTS